MSSVYSEMGDLQGDRGDFDIINSNKISALRKGRAGDEQVEVNKDYVGKEKLYGRGVRLRWSV